MSATMTRPAVVNDPTAWLRGTAAARASAVRTFGCDIDSPAGALVIASLTDPPQGGRDRWERACDRCNAHCPAPLPFFTGRMRVALRLVVTFGLCEVCVRHEVVT